MEFSSEQLAVINSNERRLVVSAAAGSGKTRVLVEKYLRHIDEGFSPDEILAVTFTRKAAAEMKERIVSRLTALEMHHHALIAETGPIQTVHSFYERILRENAVQAGVDPSFEILDDVLAHQFAEEAVRGAFSNQVVQSRFRDLFLDRFSALSFEKQSNRDLTEEIVQALLNGIRGSGLTTAMLESTYLTPESTLDYWYSELGKDYDIPFQLPYEEWIELIHKKRKKKLSKTAENDLWHAENTVGFVELVCDAWQRFEADMRRRQMFDQTLTEEQAVRLLEEKPYVRERVNRQYRVVLVDESQDLNFMQHRFLSQLDPEWMMLVGDAQQSIYGFRQAEVKLFQSLQETTPTLSLTRNFRCDSPGVLEVIDTIFESVWEGYRPMSLPRVVSFDEDPPPRFVGTQAWSVATLDFAILAQEVGRLVEGGKKPSDITVLLPKNAFAKRLYDELCQINIPAQLVAVSEGYYARLEIRDIANLLFALTNPKDDFAVLAVLRGPTLNLTLDSWVALADNKNVYSQLSNIEEIVRNEKDRNEIAKFLSWFVPISKQIHCLSAWEALALLYRDSPILECFARSTDYERLLANALKLHGIAANSPELGPRDFALQIRKIRELKQSEGDASLGEYGEDAIKIMTAHGSKGLEFDTVVTTVTLDKLFIRNNRPVRAVPSRGLLFYIGQPPHTSLIEMWSGDLFEKQDSEESWRKVYVALTRAKRELIFAVPNGKRMLDSAGFKIKKVVGFESSSVEGLTVKELGDEGP